MKPKKCSLALFLTVVAVIPLSSLPLYWTRLQGPVNKISLHRDDEALASITKSHFWLARVTVAWCKYITWKGLIVESGTGTCLVYTVWNLQLGTLNHLDGCFSLRQLLNETSSYDGWWRWYPCNVHVLWGWASLWNSWLKKKETHANQKRLLTFLTVLRDDLTLRILKTLTEASACLPRRPSWTKKSLSKWIL